MKIAKADFDVAKMARYLSRFFFHPLLFLMRGLSFAFPRNANVWVFGHPAKFEGNSKYLFLYIQNLPQKEVKAVWITRNKALASELQFLGYPAYSLVSLQGVVYCLLAQYYFVDTSLEAISYWLAGGARVINLFHALPIKKMEQDVLKGQSTETLLYASRGIMSLLMRFLFPWRFAKPLYVTSTSPLYTRIFSSMFRLPKERMLEVGYPRNDILLNDIQGSDVGVDRKAKEKVKAFKDAGGKVVMYAPTFRDTGDISFLENRESLLKINRLMEQYHSMFLVKVHPFAKVAVPAEDWTHILFASPVTDSYPLLKEADILVTDYSSIFVDFLLLNRPEIFFAYDLQKYITQDRELYFDYGEFTPGAKAYSFEEFFQVLKETLEGKDEYLEERIAQRSRCFIHEDGNSAQRVYESVQHI